MLRYGLAPCRYNTTQQTFVLKTRLQHVFSVTILRLPRHLEDVLKTNCKDVLKTCLEDVLKTCLEDVLKTCLEDMS